jgi:hypothetical protein
MRLSRHWVFIPAALVGLAGFAAPASAQVAPSYVLTDLGFLSGGTNSRAEGISPTGIVVGYSTVGGLHLATAWVGGVPQALGTLSGDTQSEARYANAAGTIVGFSTNTAFTADKAVTFTVGGSPVNLNVNAGLTQPPTGPTLTNSRGEAISATGEIVGHVYSGDFNNLTAADGLRGFYRSTTTGAVTRLDPPSGVTNYPADAVAAYGINASSHVFGQADPGGATPGYRGARWNSPSGSSNTPSFTYPTASGSGLTDYLGTQGNNVDRIVGTATDFAGSSQAFGSDGTTTTLLNNLGGPQGNAYSINNALTNVIVGSSDTAASGLHATAWNWSGTAPSPTPFDLNSLLVSNPTGMTLVEALGVNDLGQIVGYGIVGGSEHAFLLTPVPEPGTLMLCGLAVAGLAVRRRRR